MQRVTITLEDDLLAGIDALAAERGYRSRSEAFRDIVRNALGARQAGTRTEGQNLAVLSYVFDHEVRELARRLTHAQHEHHHLAVATLHVHLDHQSCLEVAVLRGPSGHVQDLADAITSQRGVRHGHLQVLPAPARHDHDAT